MRSALCKHLRTSWLIVTLTAKLSQTQIPSTAAYIAPASSDQRKASNTLPRWAGTAL
jgi:hypothetical protein